MQPMFMISFLAIKLEKALDLYSLKRVKDQKKMIQNLLMSQYINKKKISLQKKILKSNMNLINQLKNPCQDLKKEKIQMTRNQKKGYQVILEEIRKKLLMIRRIYRLQRKTSNLFKKIKLKHKKKLVQK